MDTIKNRSLSHCFGPGRSTSLNYSAFVKNPETWGPCMQRGWKLIDHLQQVNLVKTTWISSEVSVLPLGSPVGGSTTSVLLHFQSTWTLGNTQAMSSLVWSSSKWIFFFLIGRISSWIFHFWCSSFFFFLNKSGFPPNCFILPKSFLSLL